MKIPTAFNTKEIDVFWKDEPFDKVLPSAGWITDFVLHYRGMEAPTSFAAWTAISMLSSMLKRDAFLWDNHLYPNMYIVLVAPPRRNAKSTIIEQGEKILKASYAFIPSAQVRARKKTTFLHSRSTMEGIIGVMEPRAESIQEGDSILSIEKGSEVGFIISELSTFLGRQQYMGGLIDKLTSWYDCRDEDDDLTAGRGYKELKNVYVTLIGGTTQSHLEASIPPEAFGGGFMSRVCLIVQNESMRCFPEPRPVVGGPTKKSLAERLAWIAMNAQGSFNFTPDARDFYRRWYVQWFKEDLPSREGMNSQIFNRFDTHLLKLAMLIRASRYEVGTQITLDDFKESLKMLSYVYKFNEQGIENVGANPFTITYNRVKSKLKRCPTGITRSDLIKNMSGYRISVSEVNSVIEQLKQENNLSIVLDGKRKDYYTKNKDETYTWIGENA